MRQFAGIGDAKTTNERFRYLLDLGETALSLAFDLPTQLGLDPDEPSSTADVGVAGVSVAVVDDLAEIFDGIDLAKTSVAFTINATAPVILAMWIVVAEEHGVAPHELSGTLQNEMLKEFLARKAVVFDPDTSMRYSLDVVEYCLRELPRVYPVSISGGHAREAGADRDLEVACAIADAEEYLRGMAMRGHPTDTVAPSLSFIFGSHLEVLSEAAKFRAARRLYARRLKERFHARDDRSMKMRIAVNTFGSALAHDEPLNNVARATIQAIAAVLGGVQSLHVSAFDEAHRTPSPLAARVALRTQQILADETDLREFVDPLAGAPVVEDLTDAIEAAATAWLDRIDEQGGMLATIRAGWLERDIEDMAYADQRPKTGQGAGMSTEEGALIHPSGDGHRGPVQRTVVRRDCPALDRVRRDAREGRNVVPALIDAARQRATVGQMTRALAPV